jgi:N-acyl-phosphatidylethanolamine-hydrolysing phospholipase D
VDPPAASFEIMKPSFSERLSGENVAVTWVGHSTFLIQIGDVNVLTDPVWGMRVPPIPFIAPRRKVRPPFALSQLPPIDIVLISHNHYDHLESATVRALARSRPSAQWFVPLGLAPFVRKRGVVSVMECDWFESARVGTEITLHATPAQHDSSRTSFDRSRTLWCGWTISRGERRIYFAGDTGYFPGFHSIGAQLGPFDVAILPIGSFEPRAFMQYVHMNPEDSVQAFQDLYTRVDTPAGKVPVMIPMHWGTYKLTIEAMDQPARRLAAAWKESALPEEGLKILRHGETWRGC